MQRSALILHQLESSLSIAPESVARLLGVGQRTVATEVAALNSALGGSAQVRLINGRYRLRVADAIGFAEVRAQLTGERESFNDPHHRVGHILGQLVVSPVPVRIETLARGMNVGRTTVTADLVTLRRLLAPLGVIVEGRPHVGLQLVGSELAIRLAVLRHGFRATYGSHPLAPALVDVLDDTCGRFGFDPALAMELSRWLIVSLDRQTVGRELTELPPTHRRLEGTEAAAFAQALADGVAEATGRPFSPPEVLFLAIPAASRRTTLGESSDDHDDQQQARELVILILQRIRERLEIDVQPGELLGEFTHHLGFMLNRLRFGLQVDSPLDLTEMRGRFPLAAQMAAIAADVVQAETGLQMDESEFALAATYFQVFLDDEAQRRRRPFRIGIHSRRGPAAASLLRGQLAQALSVPTEYVMVTTAADVADKGVDLLVRSPGSTLDTDVPTIELAELFDRGELIRRLSLMHFPHFGPLVGEHAEGSMLVLLLDSDRIVSLPPGSGHRDAARALAQHLVSLGQVPPAFPSVLTERLDHTEPVVIGDRLFFPHASDPKVTSVSCALGIVPEDESGPRRVVFLMAVPEKDNYDDRILVRTYEELIRLGTDSRLMDRLCAITSYPELLGLLEDFRDHNQGK